MHDKQYYERLCEVYIDIAHHYSADVIPLLRKHQSELEAMVSALQTINGELQRENEQLKFRLEGLDK